MRLGASMPAEKGQGGAHTPRPPENPGDRAAAGADQAVLPDAADLRPALAELLPPEPVQFDLLAERAEKANAERRGRGRPAGSANKRNDEVFDTLDRMGYKNPVVRLMEIVSADVRHLGCDVQDALKLQIRAAEVLLPYMLAKKPQEVQVSSQKLHLFLAGSLSPDQVAHIEQNQLVSLPDDVGENGNPSHDAEINERDQGDSTG